ncbi:MAG: ribosome biogenesis GTPase Der [Phycisphaerae bacterium]|nr:ribosome biogenesis GTPase Der [Phycisphaerae bacterium]
MALPTVAIIGRPNVGKSSLLNALAGEMISIVEPTAGVTRDRITTLIEQNGQYIELMDTGGYGIVDSDQLNDHVEAQIQKAMESAELVVFMVDIRDGIMALDKKIAQILRKQNLNVIGVANKADSVKMFPAAAEFNRFGFGEFLCISATNNINKSVLLDMIFDRLSHIESAAPPTPIMKLAIVGKRNAGKSTMVNAMAGEDRVIVSEIAGTTRDAVDVRIEKDGRTIVVIDTAGVRKKNKIQNSIEFYSYVRVTKSIHRADVVFFMIDATTPISQVDKKLARIISTEQKSCVIIINKWDMALEAGSSTADFENYLNKVLPGLKYAPLAFTTATESKNIQSVLDLATEIFKQTTTWISTPKLNKAFELIKAERVGATKRSKLGWPKIYYATQVAVNPITLLLFVNKPDLFEENYLRFIISRLQSMLPIEEVPIRIMVKPHRKREEK